MSKVSNALAKAALERAARVTPQPSVLPVHVTVINKQELWEEARHLEQTLVTWDARSAKVLSF